MGLRIQLVRNRSIVFQAPLTPGEWGSRAEKMLREEFERCDSHVQQLSEICDVLSNEKRLRMLLKMASGWSESTRFTDLLKLCLNPKYVNDLLERSRKTNLVVKCDGGYRISPLGLGSLFTLSVALKHLMDELEEA